MEMALRDALWALEVVSFNIEPLSSLLLARPAGPVRILFQQFKGKPACSWREAGGRFQRMVYHPHGLATADTVWSRLPIELDARDVAAAWYLAVSEACDEAEGGSLTSLERSLEDARPAESSLRLRQLAAQLARAGTRSGEPNRKRMIGGKEPRLIELAVRARMTAARIPLPRIAKTLDPGAPAGAAI